LLINILLSSQLFSQNFSVPSPTASQITKYGSASVNESSGKITCAIPAYNYQAGVISLPIGLNYIGNGAKIDQHTNWVVTNWLLNAGGVITRVFNHIPDETAQSRIFKEQAQALMDYGDDLNAANDVLDLVDGNNLEDDLRPDLFSFSFPPFGSFLFR